MHDHERGRPARVGRAGEGMTDRAGWANGVPRPGLSSRQAAVGLSLAAILVLGGFLRFHRLGASGVGNAYYAATVQSMLASWHNFFFAAYEPGGSVSVDKPPLGFWVQAASARALGVDGFALALPQALAGLLSIALLWAMVRRQFGDWAGLAAALTLAVTPVAVATERNNTVDGLLLFVLLLAAWAFLRSVRTGRLRHLLLGAFLVGLGFNVKMLQAFMPLPALYALYMFGARHAPWKRAAHLAIATVLLVVVSLSWAVAVDLTPAEERPYVGSSTNNTVMELIVGHNGLRRLGLGGGPGPVGPGGPPGGYPPPYPPPNNAGQPPPDPPFPPGGGQPGQSPGDPPYPPYGPPPGPFPYGGPPPPPGGGGPGGNPQNREVGEAGLFRLFTQPLVTEASWVLPLALLGLPLALLVSGRPWSLTEKHLGLLLWGGWLLPELLYFSFNTGLFHAYYLIMLGPPLAALVGVSAWALWHIVQRRRGMGWALVALLTGVTVAFDVVTLRSYPPYVEWVSAVTIALWLAGLGLLAWRSRPVLMKAAMGIALGSVLVAPFVWSALTALNANPNVALPTAGPGPGAMGPLMAGGLSPDQAAILAYLLGNTDPDEYLLATASAQQASPFILATGRPVLTFGGFSGTDNVMDATRLARMTADGEVRFVLGGQPLERQKPEIAAWVSAHCVPVTVPGLRRPESSPPQPPLPPDPMQAGVLYDCGG